ncbi:DUF5753 domain-containing protein [Streptomyces sp. NPDC002138]|uniref:DUF5753 domain-containing protein n=1 Tax=Streptomyces sp. NPDC002138 TaxID=3154410 RepID=UPI0033189F6A
MQTQGVHPHASKEAVTAQRDSLSFVVWEAALIDRIGGDDVHREQLRHLRACADRPGLSLQVLPLGGTVHAGLSGPFILLETPEFEHFAYSESQRGSFLMSNPIEVSNLTQRYAMLRSQALNCADTKDLLERLLGER